MKIVMKASMIFMLYHIVTRIFMNMILIQMMMMKYRFR